MSGPAEVTSEAAATSSSGATSSGGDPLLNERVSLFLRVLFYFVVGLYLLGLVMTKVAGLEVMRLHLSPTKLLHLGMVVLLGIAWQVHRRRPPDSRFDHAVESTATLLVAINLAVAARLVPDFVPDMMMLFLVTTVSSLVLVLRAALVPGSVRRAVVVGLLVTATASTAGALSVTIDAPTPLPGPVAGAVIGAMSGVMFTIASAIVARVIYGLRRSVRRAMQLGQYTLQGKIGEGGMGAVYRASHALLRRPTAVKLLPPAKAGETAIARFEREVQHTARLTHPNTVAIYDFGHTADGVFYYAMEYLDGLSLQDLVASDGPQPPERVVHILAQVAGALGEAHAAGLIHRDVKPANILLCERGGIADVAKVLDFGLVKEIEAPAKSDLTEANVVTGTPLFLAPEALTDPSSVDGRADIYALGAVGYFMLTAEPVFDGNTLVEICGHHLHTEPSAPSERLGAELPADLERALMRCLEKKPSERFPDVTELSEALLACRCAADWTPTRAKAWWRERGSKVRAEQAATVESAMPHGLTVALSDRDA